MTLRIPDDLGGTVEKWFGQPGRAWLAALPATVDALAARWRLRLGSPCTGGSHALVLPAVGADGRPAALKVPFVDDENREEGAGVRAYDGEGAVRLHARDPETGALLIERRARERARLHARDPETGALHDRLRTRGTND